MLDAALILNQGCIIKHWFWFNIVDYNDETESALFRTPLNQNQRCRIQHWFKISTVPDNANFWEKIDLGWVLHLITLMLTQHWNRQLIWNECCIWQRWFTTKKCVPSDKDNSEIKSPIAKPFLVVFKGPRGWAWCIKIDKKSHSLSK